MVSKLGSNFHIGTYSFTPKSLSRKDDFAAIRASRESGVVHANYARILNSRDACGRDVLMSSTSTTRV